MTPRRAANEYAFLTTWHIPARPDEIAAVLADAQGLERWWPSVYLKVTVITAGDERGIGKVVDLHTKGWLPYTLKWRFTVTESDPPRGFAFRTLDGPIRPVGRGRIDALDDGTRSRVTVELDMEGHGLLGKLIRPLALRQARKEVPKNQQKLKELLESGVT